MIRDCGLLGQAKFSNHLLCSKSLQSPVLSASLPKTRPHQSQVHLAGLQSLRAAQLG